MSVRDDGRNLKGRPDRGARDEKAAFGGRNAVAGQDACVSEVE
jgi:hypothetical protein